MSTKETPALSRSGTSTPPQEGFCFCGQPCCTTNNDYSIYCSSTCARNDAMRSLVGTQHLDTFEESDSINMAYRQLCMHNDLATQQAKILSEASERLSQTFPLVDFEVHNEDQAFVSIRLSTRNLSHYRRMRALQYEDENGGGGGGGTSQCDSILGFEQLMKSVADVQQKTANGEQAQRGSSSTLGESSEMEIPWTPSIDDYEEPLGWESGGHIRSSNTLGLFEVEANGLPSQYEESYISSEEEESDFSEGEEYNLSEEEENNLSEEEEQLESSKVLPTEEKEAIKKAKKTLTLPLNNDDQKKYMEQASLCAYSLLPPTPTTPTLSIRRLIASPSRKCSSIFQRRPSLKSLRYGISSQDEPLSSFDSESEETEERGGGGEREINRWNEEVDQVVSKISTMIHRKWNPFNKNNHPRLVPRKRANTISQRALQGHPMLATPSQRGSHRGSA